MSLERDDRDEIADVLIRYATGIDTKNWPLFRSCFTDDVVCDYGDIGVWNGVDEITDFMVMAHEHTPNTKHRMTNFVIDVDGDRAVVSSYVHAVLVFETGPNDWVDALGMYKDQFVRDSNGWRIAERVFVMTRFLTNGNIPSGG